MNELYKNIDIKVIGIGGGGNNAVEKMINGRVKGVKFISIDTDVKVLNRSNADIKIHIGQDITKGMGTGANPERGRKAAEEMKGEIKRYIENADMVFIIAGMGGGTGTGAAPVIAEAAKSLNILTIAAVTRAFEFEGENRLEIAEDGIKSLREKVDTLIMIKNDNVIGYISKDSSVEDTFEYINNTLRQCVQNIVDSVKKGGICFDDLKVMMTNLGTANFCVGLGQGEKAGENAVKNALYTPLNASINNAKNIFLFISGGILNVKNVNQTAAFLSSQVNSYEMILGASVNEDLGDKVQVTIIAA